MSQGFDDAVSALADKLHPTNKATAGKSNMRTMRPSSPDGKDASQKAAQGQPTMTAVKRPGKPGTDLITETPTTMGRRGKMVVKQTDDPQGYTRGTRGKQVYNK